MNRDHQYSQVWPQFPELFARLYAAYTGHRDVEKDGIIPEGSNQRKCVFSFCNTRYLETESSKDGLERSSHGDFVVDDQYFTL